MEKGSINAKIYTTTTPIEINNAIQISVSNYSLQEILLLYKDVQISLPPATNISGTLVPSLPFKMDCLGLPFDIELLLTFPRTDVNNKVIVSYSTKLTC